MIERLVGTVVAHDEKTITVLTSGGIGYGVHAADPTAFPLSSEMTIFIYTHWSADKGSSLYGFADELSRRVFMLVITCPKIGPAVAFALLRQSTPARIVQDISTSNEKGLSGCTGVGPKKAEQIIHALKNKVGALVAASSELADTGAADWQHVQDALFSLNYSRQEVSDAVSHLTQLYADRGTPELNVLLRSALAYLAQPR
jgi:Holliday junction DNA helicase RuvA